MDYFWLAKTSNKPISLTTWLAVNPLTSYLALATKKLLHRKWQIFPSTLSFSCQRQHMQPHIKPSFTF